MCFFDFVELIESKNQNSLDVNIVRNGVFYLAFGVDAYILEEVLHIKKKRFAKNIYSAGFPINSLAKYIDILNRKNISFSIWDYTDKVNDYLLEYNSKIYDKIYQSKNRVALDLVDIKDFDCNFDECSSIGLVRTLYALKFIKIKIKSFEERLNLRGSKIC